MWGFVVGQTVEERTVESDSGLRKAATVPTALIAARAIGTLNRISGVGDVIIETFSEGNESALRSAPESGFELFGHSEEAQSG